MLAKNLAAQSDLHYQHLGVEEGLSQSSVYSIFQDKHGFMWFATGDGLNRYDGKGFVPYKSKFNDNTSSRPSNRNINSVVFEDKNNILWFASDAGISFLDWRYARFGVEIANFKSHIPPTVIGMDGDLLWFMVPHSGLYTMGIIDKQYKVYPIVDRQQTGSDTVCAVMNGALTRQRVWVADRAGLLYFDKITHQDQRVLENKSISSVRLLTDGKLLLTTTNGVYFFDTTKKSTEFFAIKNDINDAPYQWNCAVEDSKTGAIYIGAVNSGVICKLIREGNASKYEFINIQKSHINCLYIDCSQNLWVGTEGNGVYKLDIKPPKFCSYLPNTLTQTNENEGFMVKSIFHDDSGKTWIGTYDKGLVVVDLQSLKSGNISFPFSVRGQLVSSIFKDSTGNIVTTIGDKILWLDEATGKIKSRLSMPLLPTLSGGAPTIYCINEWKKDHFMVGTNLGLYTVKNEKGNFMVYPPSVFRNFESRNAWAYSLCKEKNGVLYVGKRNGYLKIKIHSDTSFQVVDEGFTDIVVRHFYKSPHAPILWIATEKGLIAYNETTKHYKVFDETNGLANSSIYAILPQSDTELWVSTNHGLIKLSIAYGKDTNLAAQFYNYTAKDGLQSNEFNTGAYYLSKDGTMYFGGIAGINWFNPFGIKGNSYKALPAITEIFVNEHFYSGDTSVYVRNLRLPYDQNTISFSLRALEFTQPGQNQFAYKLDGLDNDWVYTTNDKVRYSNLQYGNYTFLLKVSNNEGLWNKEALEIHIVILPPFWKTWWFNSLIFILFASIVMLAIKYYVQQKVKAKTRELEQQKVLYIERLRISKDVHDDLGSGLSKISLMAEIAHNRVDGNIPLGKDLKQISSVSKELVDNMRELIWVLNPENTNLSQLVSRLREYCADYLEQMPVTVNLDFPDHIDEMRISTEVQRNIFLTVKEAINNCIKHSVANEITIRLSLDNGNLKIYIADNGNGFDQHKLKGSGNGLRNMKARIELIGGQFDINSSSAGTIINIFMSNEKLSEKKV